MSFKRFLVSSSFSIAVFSSLVSTAGATLTFSDFSFGSGTPFGGTTSLAGTMVTLVSTTTQPFGTTSFRDDVSLNPASVTFTFDSPISEFHLDVSFVRKDEFLTGFSIGAPTSLTGTLVNNGGLITSSTSNDLGFGRLSWTNISAATVSFTIDADGSGSFPALAVDQFGIDVIPLPVPTMSPGAVATLLVLILGASVVALRRMEPGAEQAS
jgi:hypothetical protein